ncbi:MAG: AsmA family protein [Pseudomonadota bacterium]
MWFGRIVWMTAATLVVVVVAAVLVLNNGGLDRFREPIEARLSDALGRKVEIRGSIGISLDYRPVIEVHDIWIANPSWADGDALATIETVELQAELMPLLRRQYIIDEITLTGVDVNLQEDENQTGNWEPETKAADAETSLSDPSDSGPDIDFRTIRIEQLDLLHVDPLGTVKFDLVEGHLTKDKLGEALAGELVGVIEGFDFDVDVDIAQLQTLIENKGRSGAKLGGVFGGVTFEADGHIGVEDGDFAYSVNVSASAGAFDKLAPDLKDVFPSGRPFTAAGTVEGGFADLKAEGLAVDLGERKAAVDLHLVYPRQGRLYSGKVRSDRLALSDLLPEPAPASDSGSETDDSDPEPEKIGDLDFAVQLGQLDGLGLPFRNLDVAFKVTDLDGRFDIHSLEIANAPWGKADNLAQLDEFSLTFPFGDLLQDKLHFQEAALFKTEINLEKNEDGDANWDLLALPEDDGGSSSFGEIWLERVKITDFNLGYADGDDVVQGRISGGSLRMEKSGAPIGGFVDGEVNSIKFETDLSLASIDDLFADPPKPSLDVDGTFGGLKAQLQASLNAEDSTQSDQAASSDTHKVEGSIQAQAPGALAPVFGEFLPRIRPLNAEFSIHASESTATFDSAKLTLGESEVSGQGSIDMSGDRPKIVADLKGDRLKGKDWGLTWADDEPTETKSDDDDELDLSILQELDLDLRFKGSELDIDRFKLTDLELTAVIDDGNLTLKPVGFDIGKGSVDAVVDVRSSDQTYRISHDLRVTDVPIDLVFVGTEVPEYIEAPFYLRTNLAATGNDWDAIIASANGDIRLFVGRGQVQAQFVDLIIGGLRSFWNSLFSDNKNGWVDLNCAVLEGPVRNGVLKPRILYLNTASSSVAGQGEIDFATDTIGLTLTPRANAATLNISVPMRVQGPLEAPRVTPQPDLGTALKGLTVAASAFLFPPAAVAAFVDFGVGDRCLKEATKGGVEADATQDSNTTAQ